tara:strand:- start:58063 stop:59283 length:1221 start_codon:yes stop_codon:yes gene_type:complete
MITTNIHTASYRQLFNIHDNIQRHHLVTLSEALEAFWDGADIKHCRKSPSSPIPYSFVKTKCGDRWSVLLITNVHVGSKGKFGVVKIALPILRFTDAFIIDFPAACALKIIREQSSALPANYEQSSAFHAMQHYYPDTAILTTSERIKHNGHRLIYIAMPLLLGMDLQRYLVTYPHQHTLLQYLEISLAIAREVENLHDKNFVHGDIKPENIIINTANNTMSVQLIDFDGTLQFNDEKLKKIKTKGFYPTWLNENYANAETDIYAVAICIVNMLGGLPPNFPNATAQTIYDQLGIALAQFWPAGVNSTMLSAQVKIRTLIYAIFFDSSKEVSAIHSIGEVVACLDSLITNMKHARSQFRAYANQTPWPCLPASPVIGQIELPRKARPAANKTAHTNWIEDACCSIQ